MLVERKGAKPCLHRTEAGAGEATRVPLAVTHFEDAWGAVRSATIYDGAVLAGIRLDRWETMHAQLVLEIGTQVAACGLLDVVRAIRLR